MNCIVCNSEFKPFDPDMVFCCYNCHKEYNDNPCEYNRPVFFPHSSNDELTNNGYGRNWNSQKKLLKKKYGNACQECGATDNIQTHHIIPRKDFDSYFEANKFENLTLLCNSCHGKKGKGPRKEKISVRPPKYHIWDMKYL